MGRTILVEPNPHGHHFDSVRAVAEFVGPSDVVLLTSEGAGQTAEFDHSLMDLGLDVRESFTSHLPDAGTVVRATAAVCREGGVTAIVIMDGDKILPTWPLRAWRAFGRGRRRPRTYYFLANYPARLELRVPLRQRLMRAAKTALVLVALMNRTIDRASCFATRDQQEGGFPIARAHDATPCHAHSRDRDDLRRLLHLPQDRPIVSICGGINARKNPQLVLQAVERVPGAPLLLLAGPASAEVRAWIDALPPARRARLIIRDDFLSDVVLDQHLAASDVVVLLMTLEGPSGIQGKALAAGVPVVSAGSRARAREIRTFGSGIATDALVDSLAVALGRILTDPARYTPSGGELSPPDSFAAAILGSRAPQ